MQCYTKRPQINPCFTEAIALTLIQLSKESPTLFSSPTLPCHFFISISKEEEMTCVYIGLLIFWDHPPKVSKCGIFREPFFFLCKTLEAFTPKGVCQQSCAHAKGPGDTSLLHLASDGCTWPLPPRTAPLPVSVGAMSPLCTSSLIRIYNPPG